MVEGGMGRLEVHVSLLLEVCQVEVGELSASVRGPSPVQSSESLFGAIRIPSPRPARQPRSGGRRVLPCHAITCQYSKVDTFPSCYSLST